jgi:hypothetical protein
MFNETNVKIRYWDGEIFLIKKYRNGKEFWMRRVYEDFEKSGNIWYFKSF